MASYQLMTELVVLGRQFPDADLGGAKSILPGVIAGSCGRPAVGRPLPDPLEWAGLVVNLGAGDAGGGRERADGDGVVPLLKLSESGDGSAAGLGLSGLDRPGQMGSVVREHR